MDEKIRSVFRVGFPTGRDSTTFRDNETEVSSLSRDKGTTGQAQNLAKGWDGQGQFVKIWDGTQDNQYFSAKIRDGTGTGQLLFFSL